MFARHVVVRMSDYTVRPYRLYNARTREYLRWRCYLVLENARIGALIECKYAQAGDVIELINIVTAQLLGQYKRTSTGIGIPFEADEFSGGARTVVDEVAAQRAKKLRRAA